MEQVSNKKHYPFITLMYAIGVLLVLFGHSHPLHIDYPNYMHRIIGFVYCFHMPLFFAIAGMLIWNSRNTPSISKWWLKKVYKLIAPYLVLSFVAAFPKFLLGDIMNDDMELSVVNILKIIFMPRHNIWGHFWFIPVYLLLTLIGMGYARLLAYIDSKKQFPWAHVFEFVLGGIALFLSFNPFNVEWFGLRDISIHLIYILIGISICKYFVEKNRLSFFNLLTAFVLLCLSIALFIVFKGVLVQKAISLIMLLSVIGLSKSFKFSSSKVNSFLQYVGNHAFTIFIWSWPVQAVIEILLVLKLGASWFIVFPVLFLSGLMGPIIIYEGCKKLFKNNKYANAMVGC